MRESKIKSWILIVCMVLLTYPFVEMLTPIEAAGMVNRSNLVTNVEAFTAKSWFDGSFQESAQNFINDNIGLFPLFINIHNQLEYSLFENIYTGNVVKGKNNYLFEQGYLDAYAGKDYVGHERIASTTQQLKSLQDTLQSMGKLLMVCLTANKTTYFPEFMPDATRKDSTNLDGYLAQFDANGINYMNCNPWFLEMKDTLGYLLFPPYGIHWSHYSTILVADSIARYMAQKTSWPLADLRITKKEYSKKTKYYDNDIAHSMNLFYNLEPDSMLYPEFVWTKPEKPQPKRKLLIVGDSFTWDIFESSRLGTECFDEVQFWFYNQTVHTKTNYGASLDPALPMLTRHLNLAEILQDYDAFLIICNDPNLANFGWGFMNDALKTLADKDFVPKERNNDYLADQAKNKKEWREQLEKLAAQRGISLDSMIHIYLHDHTFKPE